MLKYSYRYLSPRSLRSAHGVEEYKGQPKTHNYKISDYPVHLISRLNFPKMHSSSFFFMAVLSIVLTTCSASIPSMGLETVQAIREELPDNAFNIRLGRATRVVEEDWSFNITNLKAYPALGAPDVQTTIERGIVKSGKSFPTHYHPRATEIFICFEGKFETFIRFEGLVNAREIRNTIRTGDSTVYPEGLTHGFRCASRNKDCVFYSVLQSADPGTVGVK